MVTTPPRKPLSARPHSKSEEHSHKSALSATTSASLHAWSSSDLLHRVYHVPAFGQGYVDHYSEGYEGIIVSAAKNNPNATHDSDGLQYFALEAYAYDVIAPGVGCPGPGGPPRPSSSTAAAAPATSSTTASSTVAAASLTVSSAVTASTSALPANCHTHADGSLHCV